MSAPDIEQRLLADLNEAETKAIDSLARYKFAMFGYWAGIWVHLNRVGKFNRPSPFAALVKTARFMRDTPEAPTPPLLDDATLSDLDVAQESFP